MKILCLLLLVCLGYAKTHAAEYTLDLYSDEHCAPCVVLKKRLAELGQTSRIVEYNCSDVATWAYAQKQGVVHTPTVIVRDKNGKELGRWEGLKSLVELRALLALKE